MSTLTDFGEKIWEVLIGLVKHAETAIPGDGKAKKAAVIDWVSNLVNMGESLLPVAKWANTPAVDGFERFVIGLGVEWAWTQLQLPEGQRLSVASAPELNPAQLA